MKRICFSTAINNSLKKLSFHRSLGTKSSSYFSTLLVSNIILFLVAALAVIFNYLGYRENTVQYINSYNMVLLSQIRNIMDERLNSVSRLAINISKNDRIVRLGYHTSLDSGEAWVAMVEAHKELESYATVYSYLNSAYVYYEDSGFIVANTTSFKDVQTFCLYQPPEEEDIRYWQSFIENGDYFGYWSQQDQDQFTVAYRPRKKGRALFYVVLNVNYSFLEQFGKDKDLFHESLLIAKNDNGETMFTLGSAQYLTESLYNEINKDFDQLEGSRVFELEDQRVFATKIRSSDSHWSYYFVIPEDMFVKRATNNLVVSLVLLLLGICLILAVVLARVNAVPIRRLVSVAEARNITPQPLQYTGNELEYVTQIISRSADEYQKLQDRLVGQIPILQAHAVLQMLSSGCPEDAESFGSIGIRFPHRLFYAAVFHLESAKPEGEEKQIFLAARFRSALQACAGERLSVYTADADISGEFSVIFNLEEQAPTELLKDFYTRLLADFNSPYTVVTVAVGKKAKDLNHLPESYANAVRTLQNRLLKAPGGIAFSEGELSGGDAYYYPMELESQLMQSVKSGKIDQVNSIFNNIIMENFIHRQISMEAARCLMFNMMGTAFRVLGVVHTGEEAPFQQQETLQEIFSCTNLQEMEVTLRSMYTRLCAYINGERRRKSSSLISQIKGYIDGNYTDCNMSLTSVSAEVGLNSTYLSSYFKEQTGENFQSYLARIRLEASLSLLVDSELSVNEAAVQVGYSNTAVYIRNFKKVYGVTPGQYRDSHKK